MGGAQTSLRVPGLAEAGAAPDVVSFGPFAYDMGRRLLSRSGQELPVPPRVLGVLDLLLRRAGEVVPRQAIIDTVWKDAFVTDTSLAEAVSLLRQLLGDDPQSPTYIQTLHRRGYRFVAPIAPPPAAAVIAPTHDESQDARVSPSIGMELVPWSIAIICALTAAAAVWQFVARPPALTFPAAQFKILAAPETTFDDEAPALAMSQDGALIAWSGCDATECQLFTRPLDRFDATAIAGTQGARAPFFSPDGRWIAYFADGRLMKVAIAGGAPIAIADAPTPLGGTWIGSEIVFAGFPTGGLMRVAADGGEPRVLTIPDEANGDVRHSFPSLVPGTRTIVFTIDTTPGSEPAGSDGVVAALTLDGGAALPGSRWRTLVAGAGIAQAIAGDTLVFGRGAELHAVVFDRTRLATAGVPRPLLTNVATAHGRTQFAVSSSGQLLYVSGHRQTQERDAAVAGKLRDATISPDGQHVAGVQVEAGRSEIWVSDVRRGTATRLMHSGFGASPVWSPDGRTVYVANRTAGAFEIWRRDAAAATAPVRLFGSSRHALPVAASPDGTLLAFLQTAEATRSDLWLLPLDGRPPTPLVQTPFDEGAATFSPDSSMVAFQSAETGRWEIYVQRIADGRRTVVSAGSGGRPVWTRSGLFYQSGRAIVRASIASRAEGPVVEDAAEIALSESDRAALRDGTQLQGIAADDRILLSPIPEAHSATAILSLDWLREVRAVLGPPETRLPR